MTQSIEFNSYNDFTNSMYLSTITKDIPDIISTALIFPWWTENRKIIYTQLYYVHDGIA